MSISATPGVLATYGLAFTATAGVAMWAGGDRPPALALVLGATPVVVPLALARVRSDRAETRVWQASWAIWCAAMALAAFAGRGPFVPYGDGAVFAAFVEEGQPVPRWLLGSALASWLHAAVWEFPPVSVRLPATMATARGFLSLLCLAAAGGGALVLLRRWPNRLAVVLPLLTPLWVLFASGYVEYYPLIAPAYLAVLVWLFDRPFEDRPPWQTGPIAAGLSCAYVGFAPVSATLLVLYGWHRRRDATRALGAAVATAAALIVVCWPGGVVHYVRSLYGVMNFGETALTPRYAGMTAGPASIFFAPGAVLSATHLGDLVYMTFWTGIALGGTLLAGATLAGVRHDVRVLVPPGSRTWLGLTLLVWHVAYLVLMIPRLGPTRDLDLFFMPALFLPCAAGVLFDRAGRPATAAGRATLVAGVLGTTSALSLYLVWLGVPPRG